MIVNVYEFTARPTLPDGSRSTDIYGNPVHYQAHTITEKRGTYLASVAGVDRVELEFGVGIAVTEAGARVPAGQILIAARKGEHGLSIVPA